MATPKRTEMKRLSQVQYFHLVNWLNQEVPNCAPSVTHIILAERASETLKFPVSQFSIGDAMRDHGLKVPGPKAITNEEKIEVLARYVKVLWQCCYPVNKVPDELRELLK